MGHQRRTVAAVMVSGALIVAWPTVAAASWPPHAASAPAIGAAKIGPAVAGPGSAGTGGKRLFFGGDVIRYDRRTMRWGPCYAALDAKGSGRHIYVTARFYSYKETCRDEFAAKFGNGRAPINKVIVPPGQWAYADWYFDRAHNAVACVSIDDFNYVCTAPY